MMEYEVAISGSWPTVRVGQKDRDAFDATGQPS